MTALRPRMSSHMPFGKSLGIALACLCLMVSWALSGCGARHDNNGSDLDSVEVPQTAVQDQGSVGFCWAYSSMALIESQHKLSTGEELTLSPEALGFYRMVEGLYEMTRQRNAADILAHFVGDDLEGFFVKNMDSKSLPDAFSLLATYGVVPESIWKFKFESAAQVQTVKLAIKSGLIKLVWSKLLHGKDAKDITPQEIIDKVMTAKNAFPSAPPREFVINGQVLSSVDYMRRTLGFQPEDYGVIQVVKRSDLPKLIAGLKRSLVRGVDPILGFPVRFDLLHKAAFSGAGLDVNNADQFKPDGWHAVAISDFVNKGSRAGALSVDDIEAQLARPAEDLDYLVVKNSWGIGEKVDSDGNVNGSVTGYYTIDLPYLQGSAAVSEVTDGGMSIVVPADIAADPFGAESVNVKVAAK